MKDYKLIAIIGVAVAVAAVALFIFSPEPTLDIGVTEEVAIQNFAFEPNTITVKAGTTILWVNKDLTPHILRSTMLFESLTLKQHEPFAYTFGKPGTYEYYCTIHPKMKGTVTVE